MRWLILLLTVSLFILCTAESAFADGKVFGKSGIAYAGVNIPDQEALIHWADGIETMVIRTSYIGEGDEFAWIVPTPAEPEVSASTNGLFPALRAITSPRVQTAGEPWGIYVTIVTLIVICWLLDYRSVAAAIILISLLVMCLFPALGTDRRSMGADAALDVLQQTSVGDFEVAVLSADDPDSLLDWLKDNGFNTPEKSVAAIQAYIDEGWVFTALRLKPDIQEGSMSTTHPVAFRFATSEPIYPMRLTATGSTGLLVDLYIFGHQRATAAHFDVAYCDGVVYPPEPTVMEWSNRWAGDGVPVRHPELVKQAGQSAFATKLSAQLTPADMQKDVRIRWDGEQTHVPRPWTRSAAKLFAFNIGITGAVLSLLIYVAWVPMTRERREPINAKTGAGLFIGAIVWIALSCIMYQTLPVTDVRVSRTAPVRWQIHQKNLKLMVISLSLDHPTQPGTDEWLDEYGFTSLHNPYDWNDTLVGDQPGQFTYEWTEAGPIITVYGPDGAPLRIDGIPEEE